MSLYLTKSDFKVASTCPTKLYYRKKGYPTTQDDDEYLAFLAEGGYMVGKLAQLYFPDGIEMGHVKEPFKAVQETMKLLEREEVTLFEAAVQYGQMLVRIDVLVKKEDQFELVEVKSGSYDSNEVKEKGSVFRGKKGLIKSDWREYLEDVTYQTYVLQQAFPSATIKSFLMMPDKSKNTKVDGLTGLFKIREIPPAHPRYKNIRVDFTGSLEEVLKDDILTKVNVDEEVAVLMDEVKARTDLLLKGLKNVEVSKLLRKIDKECRGCEFRGSKEDIRDGYKECWGELADESPHLFDLYFATTLGGKGELTNALIDKRKVSLFNIPESQLSGKRGIRQKLQIQHTRKNSEWFSDDLKPLLNSFEYPLYFVDFETSRLALPYHRGMRPYENVAFQWSIHVKPEKDSEYHHLEWINTKEQFPNFRFAESLMEAVQFGGTLFMWASYENTILRDIYRQMEKYGYKNKDLKTWLERTVQIEKEDNGRFQDMNRICFEHYFHPMLKGRTSLKAVLPAIWNTNRRLHGHPAFKKYVRYDGELPVDPYETLGHIEIFDQSEVVKEGTGAMMAYQEMMYGVQAGNKEILDKWTALLLQYCELDTAAMAVVWEHWTAN